LAVSGPKVLSTASSTTITSDLLNKTDLAMPGDELAQDLKGRKLPTVRMVARQAQGIADLREALIRSAPDEFLDSPPVLGDLIAPGDLVVLVVPIDLEAPRGRLILPQVQSIRDVLDHDSCCMVVKERELRDALDKLKEPPALVVTDSQAFLRVAGDTPASVPMTSFSILFARLKGDLNEFAPSSVHPRAGIRLRGRLSGIHSEARPRPCPASPFAFRPDRLSPHQERNGGQSPHPVRFLRL
jgi:hypothetical protein